MENAVKTLGSYAIPEGNLEELKAKLARLERKAAKLGVTPITYAIGEGYDVPFKATRSGPVRIRIPMAVPHDALFIRYFPLTLSGVAPAMAGWTFLATLLHLTDGEGETLNMLRTVPGFEGELPHRFRTATPETCEHCNKAIRTRKETFVVREEATGTYRQVGRNCLADFLGGRDPHAVAEHLEMLCRACEAAEESEGGGYGTREAFRLGMFHLLCNTAALIRVDGWLSRGKARSMGMEGAATADGVIALNNPPSEGTEAFEKWSRWAKARATTDRDREIAEKALTHAREVLAGRSDLNDYEFNLYVATVQESVGMKLVGIAASLIPYYLREVERMAVREAERKRAGASEYFGTEGKREDFYLTCTKVIPLEGNFGTTFLHRFVTREGNTAKWFASVNPEMEIGKEYRVTATVKEHGEWKGFKETALTRVAVYSEEARKAAEEKDARKAAKAARATAATTAAGPVVVDEALAEKRKAAGRKAAETRRANAARAAAGGVA